MPSQNYYNRINNSWISKQKIPRGNSRWSNFNEIGLATDKWFHLHLKKIKKKSNIDKNIITLWKSGMNTRYINQEKLNPIITNKYNINLYTLFDVCNLHQLPIFFLFF